MAEANIKQIHKVILVDIHDARLATIAPDFTRIDHCVKLRPVAE